MIPLRRILPLWSIIHYASWALGNEKRFGLVHVDFDTLERHPKQSFETLNAGLSDRAQARLGLLPHAF
jgi:beta-glucosidase